MTTSTIGFIGLGRMGAGMATNLAKSGHDLHVFDLDDKAVARLQASGATNHRSAAGVADAASLLFVCLPFAPEVRDTIFGADGVASRQPDGITVVDTTTLLRSDALSIAEESANRGIEYWDCPISGMPFRADDGSLTVMFGGTAVAFERVRPYLECIGKHVIHCGPIGSGQAMKAINNVIYDVNIAALAEMLPLAVAAGLDTQAVADVVTSASGRSFASEYFVPRMLARRFDTDFAMGDAYKDIVNVQNIALETKAMLPVVSAMIASYQATMAAGYADEPKSAMLKLYENALGVEFRAEKEK